VWLSSAIELYIGIVSFYLCARHFLQSAILTMIQICTSAPPTKPFFLRYVPKLLTATSQYFPTTRGQGPTLASSKNVTFNHTNSLDSRDLEDSAGLEFEEMSGRLHMKNSQIHKKVEISQSWLDVSRPRASSSKESIEKLVR
jgi:hypothetical protein